MFISECILPGDKLVASRQEETGALRLEILSCGFFLNIHGATDAEIDAMAAAINAPIERMKRERGHVAPAPKRKFVRWVNMYEHTATVFTYETKEIADRDASQHRTACIRVEFEEGDGL